jgi:hypothetical protein
MITERPFKIKQALEKVSKIRQQKEVDRSLSQYEDRTQILESRK